MTEIRTHEIDPAAWPDLDALLGAAGGCDGCWCMNHRDETVRGEAGKRALHDLVAAQAAGGVLAYVGASVVGWCALDVPSAIPDHDCATDLRDDDDTALVAHCFFVSSEFRGRGVAKALLAGAVDVARGRGVSRVVGFPSPPEPADAVFSFFGPYTVFRELGFEEVRRIDGPFCRVELAL
ncbi:MAG: GNAT family N-acetyltransferase [Planctomycetota bacterium]